MTILEFNGVIIIIIISSSSSSSSSLANILGRKAKMGLQETHLTMGTASQYCLRWNNHQTNLLSAFDLLLRQEAFTDVTLACEEGVTLHAHRLVLAACSSYFANLFSSTSPSQHPIVVLKDVRSSEMRALLYYMYRGEVNVEQSKLKELLRVAEGLRVKGLVEDLASSTQTHPLPLVTSNPQPLPLLVTSSQRHTPGVTPSPTPVDSRSTPSCSERLELDPIYTNSIPRPFHSPPPSPYKRPKTECKDEPHHIRVPSPQAHSYFSPYLSHHTPLNHPPRVPHLQLDPKDHKSVRETYERENVERPSRPPSEDHRERRPSPLPISQHLGPYSLPVQESPSPKRPRQAGGELLISPTPILRTALGHTRSFQPDVTSLVSLASSMMPLPPLLSARTQSIATSEELRRASEAHRDTVEQNYNLQIPKKSEALSDEDSRQYIDITREDEPQEKSSNGQSISDFSNFHIDPSNPSHYSNFVSYVPTPKPEWKRYKQYTKTDLMQAIEAVRKGMTALQASRKYKVPSRTLYDKIKKMGINTIPRRLPAKRPSTTDIEVNEPSLHLRPASSGTVDGKSSVGEFFSERPHSGDSSDHLSLPSLQIRTSLTPEEEKVENREDLQERPVSQQEESVIDTSTRGSFSLVGTKVFSEEEEPAPLDLTETEGPIPTRSQIQERA